MYVTNGQKNTSLSPSNKQIFFNSFYGTPCICVVMCGIIIPDWYAPHDLKVVWYCICRCGFIGSSCGEVTCITITTIVFASVWLTYRNNKFDSLTSPLHLCIVISIFCIQSGICHVCGKRWKIIFFIPSLCVLGGFQYIYPHYTMQSVTSMGLFKENVLCWHCQLTN